MQRSDDRDGGVLQEDGEGLYRGGVDGCITQELGRI